MLIKDSNDVKSVVPFSSDVNVTPVKGFKLSKYPLVAVLSNRCVKGVTNTRIRLRTKIGWGCGLSHGGDRRSEPSFLRDLLRLMPITHHLSVG